ncbi:MAG TPA: carboxypeptidase-like regulatory domain-containing protein [Candidatus Acidoferrum sp.]|jgi:hypothetical protein|nr:carboxypeptidase-like regulatory domain-containing protein [Candidatus Acidoferrum sp.]
MYPARKRVLVFHACVLTLAAVIVRPATGQDLKPESPSSPTSQFNSSTSPAANSTSVAGPKLRVRLRLEDNSQFLGAAEISLTPSEGYEVVGSPSDTDGDTLFTGLAAGKYTLEARAPGFLSLRMSMVIEATQHERILYLVMKPRPMARRLEQAKEESLAAGLPLPGANSFLEGSEAAASGDINFWMDHDLEINVPPVDPSVECPVPEVLKGVGEQMKEFVSNLEKFTATEEVQHQPLGSGKNQQPEEKRQFAYVVTISRNRMGTFLLEEYRDGSVDVTRFPSRVATNGLPALNLIFHPVLAGDFQFKCEGLGQAEGKATWQVHFAQRADKQVRIRSYVVGERTYRVYLEGRAWIDPGNYQVIRLESELQKPVPEIGLRKEHIVIHYAPVEFRTQKTEIWLPQKAELYVEKKGQRYYRRHTFTNFMVFNVETAQSIQAPKGSYIFINSSDQDIAGVLTVIPGESTKREAVTLRFVVPARRRVFKVVGPGKDVNLPLTAVASATFEHEGKAESMRVEASLANETTLDVIPEAKLTKSP